MWCWRDVRTSFYWVKFIVWDEVFMVHRYGFETVTRLIRHLRSKEKLFFRGCTILILGDLRQTLPVFTKNFSPTNYQHVFDQIQSVKALEENHTDTNTRVLSIQSVEDREYLQNFCDYLIKMGDRKSKTDVTGVIQIPKRFLLPTSY